MQPKITIYTRPGCHLCDEAKSNILAAAGAGAFDLEEVNVDLDPDLKSRYGNDVPVVTINGIMVFKHRVETPEFERKLRRFSR
jgi:glutaredoxin